MTTAEYLTVKQVEERYPRQWVVLDKLVLGKRLEDVKGGVVVAHGTDKEAVYAVADTLPLPHELMFWYTGPEPDDIIYLMGEMWYLVTDDPDDTPGGK